MYPSELWRLNILIDQENIGANINAKEEMIFNVQILVNTYAKESKTLLKGLRSMKNLHIFSTVEKIVKNIWLNSKFIILFKI